MALSSQSTGNDREPGTPWKKSLVDVAAAHVCGTLSSEPRFPVQLVGSSSISVSLCFCFDPVSGEFHYRNPTTASASGAKPPAAAPKALPAPKEEPRASLWRVEDEQGSIQFVLDKVGEAQTLYETLGVSGDAEKAVIRSAYRQVSLSIHPDKVGHLQDPDLQKQAENAFKVVSSAYEILNDDKSRGEYDRKLRLTGATFTSRSGGRFNLTNLAFLKKFLSKEKGGFGWDLSAKPPGDWEEKAPGVYVRGSGKPKEETEA